MRDLPSFTRFPGLGFEDRIPDGTTLWLFRGKPADAGLVEKLFERFGQHLEAKGDIARGGQMVDASVHDGQKLVGLLNKANTSNDVYGDSAYRSAAIAGKLEARGFNCRIHRRAIRHHPLSEGQKEANRRKSKIRARIEHVFGAQETAPGSRTVRARAKIGSQNLVYNIRRLVSIDRMAAA